MAYHMFLKGKKLLGGKQEKETNEEICRFCQLDMDLSSGKLQVIKKCLKDPAVVKQVSDEDCRSCPHFKSKYIQYPITVTRIENEEPSKMETLARYRPGEVVIVELATDDHQLQKKKLTGILLGEMPLFLSSSYNEQSGVLTNRLIPNPAILVPSLHKVVYGAECWWEFVDDPKFLDKLDSDQDIAWLVSYMKEYGL